MTDRCTQYALDVVAGVIIAGEYVRLACQRHLDDLEKAKAAPYKYYFDVEKSEEIINFAEELTIAEGDEQENVTAYPFQCFILGSLNGWRTKEKGHRRFRTSYVQLGRQNGKSFINGILACYYGNFDGYKYGKIFCTATKQDQANIVFDEIVKFINSDEDLSEWFKVHEHNHTIDCLCTHSEIKALSGDTKSLDGHRAYLGIVDEYHAHKTNQMYKLLEGGIKKLKSALISVITTAGFDLKSPCYKLYEYCCNLLKGVFENDSQFVYIAQLDTADDLYKKENWIKANPILEYDEDALENLVPVANTARDMGGEDLRDFLVKQLNMWMQWSNALYIKDIKDWKRCAALRTLKDFRGSKCYVGVDLSSGGDLTSIAIVIPYMVDGVKKYFVHTHSFIPASRVDEHIKTDKVPYEFSCGSVPNRGAHYGKKYIERWIQRDKKNCKYVLKMDIRHFFESVDHDVLKAWLKKKIRDERMLYILELIIDGSEVGLPLGFYTSQWLSNFMLQPLDHFIKEQLKAVHYIRYMDDMVVFGKNKKELHRMQQEIERFLREKFNLQMKGNWQVFRFDYTEKKTGKRKGRPLDFMGFQFYHDKTILRESIMLSCTRKVNRVAKKEKITWYDATAILSYMGYLSNTDTYDMYLQRVKPYVNVKKLKKIISKHSKRKEREKHERMERSVRNGGRTAGGVRHNSITDNGISETKYQESNERGCRRKENHRMAARGA